MINPPWNDRFRDGLQANPLIFLSIQGFHPNYPELSFAVLVLNHNGATHMDLAAHRRKSSATSTHVERMYHVAVDRVTDALNKYLYR